ncbi:MAG: hypothetical protein R6W72_03590 [Desulfurivibrionaceae bacterium]
MAERGKIHLPLSGNHPGFTFLAQGAPGFPDPGWEVFSRETQNITFRYIEPRAFAR